MKKKILAMLIMFVLMITTFTNVYAVELLNFEIYETAYKLSKENDINLPFINMFEKSVNYDKLVKHSGITFGESTIDVDDKLEGVHVMLTEDMVTIKGEVEHGVILAKNVVIEGKISDDTLIIAESIKILENAVVERDVVIVGGTLEYTGTTKGNLIACVVDAKINGIVEQDLRIEADTLNVENSDIKGKLEARLKTGFDTSKIKEKYSEAVVENAVVTEETEVNIGKVIIRGLKTVLVYTFVAMMLTKKEKGITTKMTARFIENSTFGILMSTLMLILSPFVLIALILAGIFGLGIIAWPVLIIYTAVILLTLALSQLIAGIFIYEVLRKRIGKYKLPALAIIFAAVFALTQIPQIASYVIAAISMISLGGVITYIFKRNETSEFMEVTETKKEEIKEVKEETKQEKAEEKEENKQVKEKTNKSKKKNKK